MWLKRLSALGALILYLGACAGEPETLVSGTAGPGADSPQQAVRELVDHLNTGDFNSAASLALPNHAALASLAESATVGEVADALRTGDVAVAANFWSGFAQGSATFLAGEASTDDGSTITEQGTEFHTVVIISDEAGRREMLVRDLDGYRVDLFASFGGGLAGRMIQPVERLINTGTDDAQAILAELKTIIPSLVVAAGRPDLPPESGQHIIQLIELITRVG